MNIRRQLILDKHLHDVDYNNGHELNEAIIAAMEEYAQEQLKNCNLQNVSSSLFHQIEILANIYLERETKAFEVADHLKAYENNIKNSVVEDIIRMIKNNDC